MAKEKRIKGIITMPAKFWTAIDNRIDSVLIGSRGDAIISMLLELQKLSPLSVKFTEPPPPPPQVRKEVIEKINNIFGINIFDITDTKLAILEDEWKINSKANELIKQKRARISELGRRLSKYEIVEGFNDKQNDTNRP